jgi:serine/threonine protein phosphatase PrpC
MGTMMAQPSKNKLIYAYSVRGPIHAKMGVKNQDAFLAVKNPNCLLGVVADGVGSAKFPRFASRKIVKTIISFNKAYLRKKIDFNEFESFVDSHFVPECYPSFLKLGMETTCLFAILYSDELILGRVGDGLLWYSINDVDYSLAGPEAEFTNLVSPISGKKNHAKWILKKIKLNVGDRVEVMLACDGVSEDLLPGKITGFAKGLLERCKKEDTNEPIKRLLENWPNKSSPDDKTIVLFER